MSIAAPVWKYQRSVAVVPLAAPQSALIASRQAHPPAFHALASLAYSLTLHTHHGST
jgi:hypothetical protein